MSSLVSSSDSSSDGFEGGGLVSTDVSETSSQAPLPEELDDDEDENDNCNTHPPAVVVAATRGGEGVSFGNVHIREYERIVGDHPDTKVGVPLSIGWAYFERPSVSLDQYEGDRPLKRGNLRLTSISRKNLLHTVFGISEEEIRNAEQENQKIRKTQGRSKQRHRAASSLSSKPETALQGITRKVRKGSWKLLKGMAAAAQTGMMVSPGSYTSSSGHHSSML